MIITNDFVYIHLPKTGGTFIARTLMALHERRGDEVKIVHTEPLPAVTDGVVLRLMQPSPHTTREHIPAAHRDKPLLATIRNPYDRYVSQFEFAWWRIEPDMFGPAAEVREEYPNYPDLTFEQFIDIANRRLLTYRHPTDANRTPGFHMQQFARYFLSEPQRMMPLLDDNYVTSPEFQADLRNVHFLRTEALNADLIDFLSKVGGYSQQDLDSIRTAPKIFPPEGGRSEDQAWPGYYTSELKALVRRREHLLLQLFPEYDL